MEQFDLIVVGGGISGMSLAHYSAKAGLRTLVIEKAERTGGTLCSPKLASEFWVEMGAHTCYNSYGNLIGIIEDCGIKDMMVPREKVGFKMLVDNRIKPIPSQLNFIELFFSGPRLFFLKKSGESLRSYYGRITGKGNYDKVFGPAFNAVLSQKADDFPADMLFNKRPRRKDIMKSFTLREGLQSLPEAVAAQKGMTVLTGKAVSSISSGGDSFTVTTTDGGEYASRFLGLATPPNSSAHLTQKAFPELSRLLFQIRMETVDTVGVAVRKEATTLPLLAGIIPTANSFYSAVSRDTVKDRAYRGFSFHFTKGLDEENRIRKITAVLGVRKEQIEGMMTKENLVPSLKVGHERLTADMDRLISGTRLLLVGNYFKGLALEDCVCRSLSEASRLKALAS
ncbi:MAG: FAD-dependent oxidoreductase [Thermodesulfovibrionales bacterium]|jgi:protoporphyrinogen oxidase